LNDKTINDLKELALIAKTIEELDEKLIFFKEKIYDKQINVFFGKKNPLFKINNLTFICTKSKNDQVLLGIITPKATNYEDHFKLFKSLINSLN
jgi:transcriptional regulator of heat shock response